MRETFTEIGKYETMEKDSSSLSRSSIFCARPKSSWLVTRKPARSRELVQPQSTLLRTLVVSFDEDALTRVIVELTEEYGRYSYQRLNALLRQKEHGLLTLQVNSLYEAKASHDEIQ